MKNLDKQVYIYSVSSDYFYNQKEQEIHDQLMRAYRIRKHLKGLSVNCEKRKRFIGNFIKDKKSELKELLIENKDVRSLNAELLKDNDVISLFDSVLTRTMKLQQDELSTDIFVIQTYYFEILKDLIVSGFCFNGEKYIYFSSSAGQIRTKRSMFVRESQYQKYQNTLTCGLSVEDINKQGGSNLNKYQSYLALTNSATTDWIDFDINKSIVVNDLETNVHSLVDYINRDTYEIDEKVKMDVPIEHTDGCGMILPSVKGKSFMIRAPWIKGLLVPFAFDKFAEENGNTTVTDIYGKEWDIVKEDIQVIFTKSQFKMWKYYTSWDDYKENFIKYDCKASVLNEEDTSGNATLGYQMLQSLVDMTDEELETVAKDTVNDILRIGRDKDVMLRVLGATEYNPKKNPFQLALLMYPELINDKHAKRAIKDKKAAMIKDAKSGKLNVNGKYTFLVPDLYAFCEKLFLSIENPKGLLTENEVYCSLFDNKRLAILRSPHLYREWGLKNNVVSDEKKKWFITEGIYTSVHSNISKLLQFDNDGDKALVLDDETLISTAERHMKGIVPLYYEMAKAKDEEIDVEAIYNSLILAYKANIGIISNHITKVWNSENIDLDVIKWLTMENNFEIDYAKTLFKPERPEHVDIIIKQYIKNKLPYFMIYAKDKEEGNVEKLNNSVVNRLEKIIPSARNSRIYFKKIVSDFDYRMLMKDHKVELDKAIIEKYTQLDRSKKKLMKEIDDTESTDKLFVYHLIREELLKVNNDLEYIVDVLVKYLYDSKDSEFKTTLWSAFGDVLVNNLTKNLESAVCCEDCQSRVRKTKQRQIRCEVCQDKRNREKSKLAMRKKRNSA